MSGRCKACNASMSEDDMCRKFPPDTNGKREYSNLCGDCHEIAIAVMYNCYAPYDDRWHKYHFCVDALVGDRE